MRTASAKCFLVLAFVAAPALAHRSHCHLKDGEGKVVDTTDITDEKACTAKNGVWKHHHDHCHKVGTEHVDVKEAKTQKACTAKGGTWSDHGHEE